MADPGTTPSAKASVAFLRKYHVFGDPKKLKKLKKSGPTTVRLSLCLCLKKTRSSHPTPGGVPRQILNAGAAAG